MLESYVVSRFGQLLDRPAHAGADGEVRRPVAAHGCTDDVLEHVAGAFHVVAELPPELLRQVVMAVAVAGHLVPGGGDAPHQRRMVLGDRAEDEEGRPRPAGGELVEQRVGIALDAMRGRVDVDDAAVVKPVLDVDRHGVARGSHWSRRTLQGARVPRARSLRSERGSPDPLGSAAPTRSALTLAAPHQFDMPHNPGLCGSNRGRSRGTRARGRRGASPGGVAWRAKSRVDDSRVRKCLARTTCQPCVVGLRHSSLRLSSSSVDVDASRCAG